MEVLSTPTNATADPYPIFPASQNIVMLRRGRRLIHGRAQQWYNGFRSAVINVFKVFRNVIAGVVLSSLFAFLAAHGNTFEPLNQQTLLEFVTANNAWFVFLFSCITIVHLGIGLMDEEFEAQPHLSRSKKLIICCAKLAWRLSPHIALSTSFATVAAYFVTKKVPAYKLAMYFTCISVCYITIWADAHARHLFRSEMERGSRSNTGNEGHKRHQLSQDHNPKSTEPIEPAVHQAYSRRRQSSNHKRISSRFVRRIALLDIPMVASAMLSIFYVHIITLVVDISKQWHFIAFTICSMLLKLVLQEAIKFIMLNQKRSPSRRLVIVAIATPTILIETQVRIYQLRLGNNTTKVMSVVILAAAEITIRALKLLIVQRQLGDWAVSTASKLLSSGSFRLRRQLRNFGSKVGPSESIIFAATTVSTETKRSLGSTIDHRAKLLLFHTAETYADMYAEYIALGCSCAMFVCFSKHPFLAFDAGSEDTSYLHGAYWLILLFQVAIEVVVDVTSSLVEIMLGIQFEAFNQDNWFIMVHMISLSFQNVGICAGLYIKESIEDQH